MNPSRLLASLSVAAVLAFCGTASAQVSATDAALAEKLFADGRQLMTAQRYAEACPKLAESERLDPGVGTLLNLAECYERSAKIASAWSTYREAEAAATREGQKKRATFAATRARELAADLSYWVVETPSPPAGLQVSCDGKALGAAALGSPMPFDAGSHRIEATAPGRRPWSQDITLIVRATVRTAVPELELAPPDVPVATAVATAPVQATPVEHEQSGGGARVTALALGGLAVVGVGLGTYFGLHAKSLYDDAQAHCTAVSCDRTGGSLTDDARQNATASTIAFSVGAVALVAGVIVYLTAPHAPRTSAGSLSSWRF